MIGKNVGCRPHCLECQGALAHVARPFAFVVVGVSLLVSTVAAQTLRVVTYNVDEDTGSNGVPGADLTTVLKGIGNHQLAGHAQPIDVLALQELYGTSSVTLSQIVNQLNATYPTANYVYDTTSNPNEGDFGTGNGPNGLIYNANTVQKLSASAVTVPGDVPRAPMRYTLAPKGYNDHSADFTIYVSHMKSGSAGTGGAGSNSYRRNDEAMAIRDDAALLGPSAHIIYSGDYNMDGSTEAGYQTMISASRNSGVGKAIDTLTSSLSPANTWDQLNTTFKWLYTESAQGGNGSSSGGLRYRDDVQYITGPMQNQPGMQLVSGTLGPFGNNGSIHLYGNVTDSNNTALADLGQAPYSAAYRTSVLNALSSATDHYPVVADYSFATAVGAPGDFDHSGLVNLADFDLWHSTFGMTGSNLLADANHNNIVDAADYLIWRRYWPGGSGASTLSAEAQVPEPAACVLILTMALVTLGGRMSRNP